MSPGIFMSMQKVSSVPHVTKGLSLCHIPLVVIDGKVAEVEAFAFGSG